MSMVNESFASLLCAGLISFLFGMALTFAGFRLFLFLLPIWGFVVGFGFGMQTMQAFAATPGDPSTMLSVTSWIVGFVVGLIFALLAYLFYVVAVAILVGSLGYALTVGLFTGVFSMNMGLIVWLLGIVVAVAFAGAALFLNVQRWLIVIASAVMGAGMIFATFLFMFTPSQDLLANPVKAALNGNFLLTLLFLVLAIAGIVVQARDSKSVTVEAYNRWGDPNTGTM